MQFYSVFILALLATNRAVVMSEGHPPAVLTRMNSVIRGIDLSSKLLSPVITGLIISFVSLKASAITFAAWATITAWVEYWLFISVYSGVPAIARSNERRILRSRTKQVEGTDAPVSVSNALGTEESFTGNPPCRTGIRKILDRVSKSSFVSAWRIYFNQEVVLPGVSLALLFFTVLRFLFSLSLCLRLLIWTCISYRSCGSLLWFSMIYWVYHLIYHLDTALEHWWRLHCSGKGYLHI